jgi:SAM-dependent methyltransferase
MMTPAVADPARDAYESFAPFYDAFTEGYEYDAWLAKIESRARRLGLSGDRLLDIGCGTGKSFMPLLGRGFRVTACDLSPAMVEQARRRAGGAASLLVADMRELPALGPFDLVTCLDDGLNYLTSEAELAAAFAGVARNLAQGGLFVFDLNSLATYRSVFSASDVVASGGAVFSWHGEGDPEAAPGSPASAVIEVLPDGDDGPAGAVTRHVQRHHPPVLVKCLLRAAGLEPLDLFGQLPGAVLEQPPDDTRHAKLLYFARKRSLDRRPPARRRR